MLIWNSEAPGSDGTASQIGSGGKTGLFGSTRVATTHGWRQVSSVKAGDSVLTFDHGMQKVVAVERSTLALDADVSDPSGWPMYVPAGALGNLSDFIVMPGQSVLVESDLAEDLMGDPFALIRAEDLDSVRGISRVAPSERVDVMTLQFENDEVVFGAGGALFLCAAGGCMIEAAMRGADTPYRTLSSDEAGLVLSHEIMPAGAGEASAAKSRSAA